jgi:hypothetical protein
MRTLTFDRWEFDPPDGEEGLEIAIAAKDDRTYPNVAAFARAVYGIKSDGKLSSPVPFTEQICPGHLRELLRRYARVELPTPCHWQTHILSNEWNDFDAVLAGPTLFIRCHWWTSA